MTKKDKNQNRKLCKLTFKGLKALGKTKFQNEEWHIGDHVRLTNGKTYKVIGVDMRHSCLNLRSEEYGTDFRADCRIINEKVKSVSVI